MKERVDLLLVARGLAESRTRAQALLLAGRVYCGERRIDKPGTTLDTTAELTVREAERYVSRGGYKIEGALDDLHVDVAGVTAVDIGASTGGFTDCLLQRGARRVFAVDVGHGQLASKLRDDARVVVMDGVNARHLEAHSFDALIELVVVDASFIGLEKLLPAIARILPAGGRLLALIKPQFQVGKEQARRHRGVIADPELRAAAIRDVIAALKPEFELVAQSASRLPGPKGNVEEFILARRTAIATEPSEPGTAQ